MKDTEEKIYVLQSRHTVFRNGMEHREYYTGEHPSLSIVDAKLFTLEQAKNVKEFAHTGYRYQVRRLTRLLRFKMALQGK